MKNTIITGKRKLLELCLLGCCFLVAFSFNVYSITSYNAPWTELITMLPLVFVISLGLYLATIAVRLIVKAIISLLFLPFRDKKGNIEEQHS